MNKDTRLFTRPSHEDTSPHWLGAAEKWRHIGPPLRPSVSDLAFFSRKMESLREKGPVRGLILGVTPQFYHFLAEEGVAAVASDYSLPMIRSVWPGGRENAVCADWTKMPFRGGSRDLVVCDGGLNLLRFPDQHRLLAHNLRRVVAPGGLCLFRLFLPPAVEEAPEAVFEDMRLGKVADINVLKLRLWMALRKSPQIPVLGSAIWECIQKLAPDLREIMARWDWPPETLSALQVYEKSVVQFYFFDLEEIQKIFAGAGFAAEEVHTPAYAMGDQCKTVALRRADEDAAG